MGRLLILAGNYRQAREWARRNVNCRRLDMWSYVSGPDVVRGIRNPIVVEVGTFWERNDAGRIYDHLQTTDPIYLTVRPL